MHEQYPFDSLNQNNLTHVGKDMYYSSKLKIYVMEPNVFMG
jgi:hypothetical protein